MRTDDQRFQNDDDKASYRSRRVFMREAVTAGILGAGLLTPQTASAAPTQSQDAQDPIAPKGLKTNGELDPRFPVTYERSVPAAVEVLTRHFAALSQRDPRALADTMHFPFASVENVETVVVKSREEFLSRAPRSLNLSLNSVRFSDHDSWLAPGLYDMLGGIEVMNFDPVRVNLAMTYNRYTHDGKRTLQCQGVYCVTNNDGKWAIQLMSTIFTPGDLIGVAYNDTVEAAKRTRINHVISYLDNNWSLEETAFQPGVTASIAGGGVASLVANQTSQDSMAMFRVKGVKTRLAIRETKAGSVFPGPRTENKFTSSQLLFRRLGHGIELGYSSGNLRETRVLHATDNKAHMFSGVTRFTPAGEEISTTMEISVVTLKELGHWGIQAMLGYITMHDRTNDFD